MRLLHRLTNWVWWVRRLFKIILNKVFTLPWKIAHKEHWNCTDDYWCWAKTDFLLLNLTGSSLDTLELTHWIACLLKYLGKGRWLFNLPDVPLGLSEMYPDDVVEDSEDEEWSHWCHGNPGPGGVPDNVVLTQSQLCGLNILDLVQMKPISMYYAFMHL